MKLSEYLRQEDMSQAAFARLTGLSEATISQLCQEMYWPKRHTIAKIIEATGGQVGKDDLLFEEAAQ